MEAYVQRLSKFYSMDHDNDVRTTKRDPRNTSALGLVGRISGPSFGVCELNFTKLSAHVQEKLQFAVLFSVR